MAAGVRSVISINLLMVLCLCTCANGNSFFRRVREVQDPSNSTGPTPLEVMMESSPHENTTHNENNERYEVAAWDFENVGTNMVASAFIFFVSLAKIFIHSREGMVKIFPESCMLIIVGMILGIMLYFGDAGKYQMNTHTFFLIILPPIIFDAGYYMPTRSFFDNLGSILMHAIIGTLINALWLGFSLYGVAQMGGFGDEYDLPMLHLLSLASLLAAVDPVAVLAVFDAVNVNEVLYIIVFGEALLNDGIAVVIYRIFLGFSKIGKENILGIDIFYGFLSFFVIVFGSPSIGFLIGCLAGFISRFTHHFKIIEPLIVLTLGYVSFIFAEMLHLSGILSATFCGITMRKYVEHNYCKGSKIGIRYILRTAAQVSEGIIFMYIGISAVNDDHDWHTGFVLLTVFFCLLYRIIGVVLQQWVLNLFRNFPLNAMDEFIMGYGGLRGAIAFALAVQMEAEIFPARNLYITTTVTVVYFTNIILGTTVEPLVALLRIPRQDHTKPTMNSKIVERLFDHTMAGIEQITGQVGYHGIRHKFSELNNNYLKPLIVGTKKELPGTHRGFEIRNVYVKLSERDAKHLSRTPSYATDLSRLGAILRRHNSTLGEMGRIDSEASLFNPAFWSNPQFSCEDRARMGMEREDSTVQGANFDPSKYAKHYLGQYKKRNIITSTSSNQNLADSDHNELNGSPNDLSLRYRKSTGMSNDSDSANNKTSTSSEGNDVEWHQQGSAIQFVIKPNSQHSSSSDSPSVFVEPDRISYEQSTSFTIDPKDANKDTRSPKKNVASDEKVLNDDKKSPKRSESFDDSHSNNNNETPPRNKSGSLDARTTLQSRSENQKRE